MKIAILSPWSVTPKSVGGTERYVLDLAQAMSDKGNDVDVITLGGRSFESNGINYISLHLIDDVNEYSLKDFIKTRRNNVLSTIAKLMESRIDLTKYDVLQINSLLFLKVCPDMKRIITMHTNPFESKMQFGNELYDEMIRQLQSQINHQNTLVIAQSKHYTRMLRRILKDHVYYIPHSTDIKRLFCSTAKKDLLNKYDISPRKVVCLLPSRLEPVQKRPQIAIKAVAKLKRQYREKIELVFCGVDDQYDGLVERLQKLSRRLDVTAKFIRFNTMGEAYKMADIVILPSKSESFGLSALESLKLGIPTILNNIPTYQEIATGNSNAYLFKNSMDSLCQSLTKLLKENCARKKTDSSWTDYFSPKRWADHYEVVLRGGEMRELFDENRKRTEELVTKNEKIPTGRYYVTVFSWIMNSDGQFLLQYTAPNKGSKWGATGGHPKAGESSCDGLISEVKEELGFVISRKDFKKIATYQTENDFVDVYLIIRDFDLNKAVLQRTEVSKIAWFSKEEVMRLIENGDFLDEHIVFFNRFIDWLDNRGKIN